nr:uncharacterized protein LOC127305731 [Lolium perenne]
MFRLIPFSESRMSGSLLLRSAGRVVQRSIPQPQGSFHRSPVRLLSGGAGRFERPNEHSSSKPNVGHTKRFEDGDMCFCRGADQQRELKELASDLRAVKEKLRVTEQIVFENEKSYNRREKVLMCASLLIVAFWVFS